MPDERSWALWGRDLGAEGLAAAVSPERADALLLPEPLPRELVPAAAAAWSRMAPPRHLVTWPAPLAGVAARDAVEPAHEHGGHEHAEHGSHADADPDVGHHAAGHEGADHAAMMEIRGEPSADGLVMERLTFELGPLAAGVPGGIVLELSLDGDVVASCRPRALLAVPPAALAAGAVPDPLAPASWSAALAGARGETLGARRLAGIECERALSHAAWLRGLGEILGWAELAGRACAAVSALLPARAALEAEDGRTARGVLEAALPRADGLRGLLERSRRLRLRTRGVAFAGPEVLEGTRIGGPVARAAGLERDARAGDPTYAALGFAVELASGGDAEARTLVRAREAAASVRLALAALATLDRGDLAAAVPVEGPRGALGARAHDGQTMLEAPGAGDLLGVAAAAVVGLELASALAGVASFDLSPWRVGA